MKAELIQSQESPTINLANAWEIRIPDIRQPTPAQAEAFRKAQKDKPVVNHDKLDKEPPVASYSKLHLVPAPGNARYLVEAKPLSPDTTNPSSFVYKGWDWHLGKEVAVKIFDSRLMDDKYRRNSIEREAKTMAKINDPGIVPIYDFVIAPGPNGEKVPIIIMDLNNAPTLSDRVTKGPPLTFEELIIIAEQVSETVDYMATKHHVFHRDIKPQNILLDPVRTKLIDFGISSWADPEEVALGTPNYISPEAAQGIPHTLPSEVFSLASTFYFSLVGIPPFVGFEKLIVHEKLLRTIQEPHFPLSRNRKLVKQLGQPIMAELEKVFSKAFEKDPTKRYQTATEFVDDFKEVFSQVGDLSRQIKHDTSRTWNFLSHQ